MSVGFEVTERALPRDSSAIEPSIGVAAAARRKRRRVTFPVFCRLPFNRISLSISCCRRLVRLPDLRLQEIKVMPERPEDVLLLGGGRRARDFVLDVQRDRTVKASGRKLAEHILPVDHAFA